MVAHTPKWNLPVEETGDPSDIPAASGRLTAAVEAALDRAVAQANAAVNGRLAKTGDVASGTMYFNGDVGTNAVLYANGKLVAAGTAEFTGAVDLRATTVSHAAIHLQNLPAATTTSNADGWLLVKGGTNERVHRMDDTVFRLIVASIAQSSTRRLKTGITDGSAPDVTRLQPRAYRWTDEAFKVSSPGVRYGLIAEDVAAVDARLATVDAEGNVAGLDGHALIAALVAKVTELQARVDALEGGNV